MAINKKNLRKDDLSKSKKEIENTLKKERTIEAIQVLKEVYQETKTESQKSNELIFHGIKLIKDNISSEDIPELINLFENLKYPRKGGETRMAYFRSIRMVSEKLFELTGEHWLDKRFPSEEDVSEFISRLKEWANNHDLN